MLIPVIDDTAATAPPPPTFLRCTYCRADGVPLVASVFGSGRVRCASLDQCTARIEMLDALVDRLEAGYVAVLMPGARPVSTHPLTAGYPESRDFAYVPGARPKVIRCARCAAMVKVWARRRARHAKLCDQCRRGRPSTSGDAA